MPPFMIMLLSVCPFMSSILKLWVPIFSTYIFTVAITFCWTVVLFISVQWSSLSLLVSFGWSWLSENKQETCLHLSSGFMKYHFISSFSVFVLFLGSGVSLVGNIWLDFVLIQSVNLCLLTEDLRSLTLRIIIVKYLMNCNHIVFFSAGFFNFFLSFYLLSHML